MTTSDLFLSLYNAQSRKVDVEYVSGFFNQNGFEGFHIKQWWVDNGLRSLETFIFEFRPDNGTMNCFRDTAFSRVLEYSLNLDEMLADLV